MHSLIYWLDRYGSRVTGRQCARLISEIKPGWIHDRDLKHVRLEAGRWLTIAAGPVVLTEELGGGWWRGALASTPTHWIQTDGLKAIGPAGYSDDYTIVARSAI